jgi:hypothetical protein
VRAVEQRADERAAHWQSSSSLRRIALRNLSIHSPRRFRYHVGTPTDLCLSSRHPATTSAQNGCVLTPLSTRRPPGHRPRQSASRGPTPNRVRVVGTERRAKHDRAWPDTRRLSPLDDRLQRHGPWMGVGAPRWQSNGSRAFKGTEMGQHMRAVQTMRNRDSRFRRTLGTIGPCSRRS